MIKAVNQMSGTKSELIKCVINLANTFILNNYKVTCVLTKLHFCTVASTIGTFYSYIPLPPILLYAGE